MSDNIPYVEVVDPCLACGQTVRPRQEAIQCENCSFWQHRICNTGIMREIYRKVVRGEEEIQWECASCLNFALHAELPLHESTRQSNHSSQNDNATVDEDIITVGDTIQSIPHSPPNEDSFAVGDTNQSITYSPLPSFTSIPYNDIEEFDTTNLPTEITNNIPSFLIPEDLQESSLDGSILDTGDTITNNYPRFRIVSNSSQKGKDMLIENVGYSYILRLKRNNATYWRCSVRNKSVICSATVTQRGNLFTRGVNAHNHSANPEVNFKPELKVYVLKRAKSEIFVPAAEIVENAMISRIENINPGLPSIRKI